MSDINKPEANDPLDDSVSSSALNTGPDAQINAHRQQHQKQIKKVVAYVACFVVLVLIGFIVYKSMTTPPRNDLASTAQNSAQPEYSQAQIDEYREQFKQALTQYEINIQPQVDKILLSDWEVSAVSQLSLQKQQMLSAFAQGLFLQAKTQFESLQTEANRLIEKWKQETQMHIENAKKAFETQDIPQAQLQLNKALALMPTNAEALELQARIDAYAEISLLLNDLKVAKIENDLEKQINLLDDIIQLDPARESLNDDLEEVKSAYDKQQLEEALNAAEKALNNNDVGAAQSFVNKALTIDNTSVGAMVIQERINQAKSRQSLNTVKQQLTTLAQQDKWEEVARISSNYLQKYPSDPSLFDKQQAAQQVLNAKKSLALFIAKPERLADQNIREAASQAIQKAFGASLSSPSLQEQIQQVGESIDRYSEAVEVSVNSDGNTYIIVVGVGHVGQHVQKTIELRPGNYVLQGRREGYKNKRLNFTVAPNTPLSLSLICDEKI